MPEFRVHRFEDFGEARRVLEPWMHTREALLGLPIGILRQLDSGSHVYEPPYLVAGVFSGDAIRGMAWRTPPYKLGLSEMPAGAIPELARLVSATYPSGLPAVLGPEREAVLFGAAWQALTGAEPVVGLRQRLYEAVHVDMPSRMPEGRLRRAREEEWHTLLAWSNEFVKEAGLLPLHQDKRLREMLDAGAVHVWEHGEACSMIAWVAPTDHGVRVAHVYTPPEKRGRGYASAATATLTKQLLEQYDFCTLYTDLSNPTSNGIYSKVGYRPVADMVDVNFRTV